MSIVGMWIVLALNTQAQDKVYVRGASQPTVGIVEKVDDTSVTVKFPQGSAPISRANVERVEIAKPPALAAGLKAVESGNASEVIQALEPLYTQYRGLPEGWIEEASARLGEAYLSVREWAKARALFVGFRKFYPHSPFGDLAVSGEARALYEMKQTDAAAKLLEGLLTEREKEESVSDEQNRALGSANVILGRCYLAAQKHEQALHAFLKTTTIYFLNDQAVAEAQFESALLFEKMNNPARAKGQLEELIKNFPRSPHAEEAKKKLASLNP